MPRAPAGAGEAPPLSRIVLVVLVSLAATLPPAGASLAADPTQDDAGTGRDAPAAPDPAFLVPTNVVHHATVAAVVDWTDVYAFEADAGDRVQVRVRGFVGCASILAPDGSAYAGSGCSYGEAHDRQGPPVTLDRSGVWYARLNQLAAGAYRFVVVREAQAPDVSLAAPLVADAALVAGADPTCGTGAPVTATQGASDAAIPTLAYAALKTGFRAVVAWETQDAVVTTLAASLDGGATQVLSDRAPTRHHVFILDGLPAGRSLCFTPEGGSPHAMRLANAMNAYDAAAGAYSVNLLVLANEQPDRAALEAALARFAEGLWDATDGHVRAGRVVTLYGDFLHHNTGWASCYVPRSTAQDLDHPFCRNVHDVLFTHDGSPVGAAQTYPDAIRDPARAIWMNAYYQAPLVGWPDDAAFALNHEMGHYAFGAQDLYGSPTGLDPDCWDPALGLSVMGGTRGATEYDDETNRCPNEATLPGYVPTWTLLRHEFPDVPARSVIDAGPAGDGGAFHAHPFMLAPQASDLVALDRDPQDDAGSGGDAPDDLAPDVRIEPGVRYGGHALGPYPDQVDVYVLSGMAGQVFQGRVQGTLGCYSLLAPDGTELGEACSHGEVALQGPLVATLPATGDYYLKVSHLAPAAYRFGFGLDAPAPDVGP